MREVAWDWEAGGKDNELNVNPNKNAKIIR